MPEHLDLSLDTSRDETAPNQGLRGGAKLRSARTREGSNRPSGTAECARCHAAWTGLAACHCSGCHRTFTGITAFDAHRSGGECIDPEMVLTKNGEPRLVRVDKPRWSGWGHPGDDTRWFGGDE